MITIEATPAELGAMYDVVRNLATITPAVKYNKNVAAVTAYLLSLHKLRDNIIPKGALGYQISGITNTYNVRTRDEHIRFTLLTEADRKGLTHEGDWLL